MTAAELIAALAKLPPHTFIAIMDDNYIKPALESFPAHVEGALIDAPVLVLRVDDNASEIMLEGY